MYTMYPLLSRSKARERVNGSWKLEQARTTISLLAPLENFLARRFFACAFFLRCMSTAVVPAKAIITAMAVRLLEIHAMVLSE